jgi:hypothetical protein
MASKDSLIMREKAAVGTALFVTSDTPVVIRLRATGAGAVTSITTTTATNIVLISANGGTDTYTFATYATVGALADAINADGMFEAVVLDALRSDATTASNFITGQITAGNDANGVVCWDVLADTSVNKTITATLSLHRNFDAPKRGHVVELQEVIYYLTLGGAGAGLFRIYQRVGGVETQLVSQLSVSATKTTVNFASGIGKITGADNADLIVRVQDASSITGTAGDYLQISGLLK